jgi:murein DD-endopeptidase MepM/ murein hydrolase activator NlpD
MGKRALLVCLVSFFTVLGAFSHDAAAQMLGERGVFPEKFVKSMRGTLTQGGLVIVTLQPDARALYDGRTLAQYKDQIVLGFGRDAPLNQSVFFTRGETARAVDFKLAPRAYVEQRIEGLPPAFVTPPAEALEKIKREAASKRKARSELTLRGGFAEAFIWPVAGRITGVYGSRRFYNGEPRRPHYGIDIAAPAGTPIKAPATGRVTLASPDMYFEGGLIFLDHGLGVTSVFMHLETLAVKVGDEVAQGHIIGTVGSTGRSTGPHLDWRMYWADQRIDPALLAPPR